MAELFDIFSGTFKKAWWIEAVEGLSNARERMQQIAEEKPGQYFLFCTRTHESVVEIQTFAMHHSRRPLLAAAIAPTKPEFDSYRAPVGIVEVCAAFNPKHNLFIYLPEDLIALPNIH